MVDLPTVQSFKYRAYRVNDRQRSRSQQIRGEQSGQGMVEMERTEE